MATFAVKNHVPHHPVIVTDSRIVDPMAQPWTDSLAAHLGILTQLGGVNDGIRTRDHRNHNPALYQLSYAHHNIYRISVALYYTDFCTTFYSAFPLSNQTFTAVGWRRKSPAARVVRPAGFEPATLGLEGRCSIHMSYGRSVDVGLLSWKKWSGQQDSNLRPSAPKADALPGCAIPRNFIQFSRAMIAATIARVNTPRQCFISPSHPAKSSESPPECLHWIFQDHRRIHQ